MKTFDSLILGAGPCGIRTAIILKQAGLDIAIIEGYTPGGKINIAPSANSPTNIQTAVHKKTLRTFLIFSIVSDLNKLSFILLF